MQIFGPSRVHGAQPINPPHRTQPAQPASDNHNVMGADQLDISQEAELLSRVHDAPDIRQEKVDQIRAQIDAGVYESDDKLDIAVERLLDEIG